MCRFGIYMPILGPVYGGLLNIIIFLVIINMDILVVMIWLVVMLIVHVLLVRFLEMRDITNQIMAQYKEMHKVPTPVLVPVAPESVPVAQNEVSMEQELMEYVYNYQEPVIDNSDKKIDICAPVGDLTSRLTPMDASNVVADYSTGSMDDYECYNDIHDQYAL